MHYNTLALVRTAFCFKTSPFEHRHYARVTAILVRPALSCAQQLFKFLILTIVVCVYILMHGMIYVNACSLTGNVCTWKFKTNSKWLVIDLICDM